MNVALAAVFGASVVGSVHCAVMCGPLVAMQHVGVPGLRAQGELAVLHALGRGLAYVAVGAVAGAVGGLVEHAGDLLAVQRVATLLAGSAMLAWGVMALVKAWRGAAVGASAGAFAQVVVPLRRRPPRRRALAFGAATVLLPCGWLWGFLVAAAGAASPLGGALVMGAFWLGTVPMMVGALSVAAPLVTRLRARMPLVTAGILVVLGLATLWMRWPSLNTPAGEMPSCHAQAPVEVTP